MSSVACEGWWEQAEFGRQWMDDLQLNFHAGEVDGSGSDIIGPFTLAGTLQNEQVLLIKQYLQQHHVEYLGSYDGEGTLQGIWRIGHLRGSWLIRIVGTTDESAADSCAEIPEWRPP